MKTRNRIWLYRLIMLGLVLILTYSCNKDEEPNDQITDKDGNVYTSVTIGTQTWMGEDLKTTKYNDGTSIPLVTDFSAWQALTTPAYSWYNYDITYKADNGAYYNGNAVKTGKLCPGGWHVPTMAEFVALETYLGGSSVAGGKMKEAGSIHWLSPNTGATNESGFTALPSGYLDPGNNFLGFSLMGTWWTSDITDYDAWCIILRSETGETQKHDGTHTFGCNVRCLKN